MKLNQNKIHQFVSKPYTLKSENKKLDSNVKRNETFSKRTVFATNLKAKQLKEKIVWNSRVRNRTGNKKETASIVRHIQSYSRLMFDA